MSEGKSEHVPSLLMTPDDVARELVVTRGMVYKLIRLGEIPSVYVGRLPRVMREDFNRYIERLRNGGGK